MAVKQSVYTAGWFFCALATLTVSGFSSPALSANANENALIDGAKLCTQYLPRHERQYGIPEHLLAAIASTESGRFHRGLGLNLPWPWTINVAGRGYFFDTKQEAVAAVTRLRNQGVQSIDVGCMQVNLRHHPKAFASVEQAFDPAYNVGYAANFLKKNFMESGSWRKATGDYHSRTSYYGSSYAQQVFSSWGRIVSKVADARAGRLTVNPQAVASNSKDKPTSSHVRPAYRSPHMHLVSVTSRERRATRENGVLVIRPLKAAAVEQPDIIQVASGSGDSDLVVKGKSVQVKQVASENSYMEQPATPVATKGPAVNVVVGGNNNQNTAAKGQFTPKLRTAQDAMKISGEAAAQPAKNNGPAFVFNN